MGAGTCAIIPNDLHEREYENAPVVRGATHTYIILARKLNRMMSVPATIMITISVENRIS